MIFVGIKSGEAPEVADIIHERYDTELEMAKSLMQQEFDETIESEQVMRAVPEKSMPPPLRRQLIFFSMGRHANERVSNSKITKSQNCKTMLKFRS
jgi:hypothetical protein